MSSEINSTSVVLGANAEHIQTTLVKGVSTLIASNWQQGLGASIAQAVRQLPSNATHVMITLADQVAITRLHFNKLVALSQRYPDKIIAARYNNTLGAPSIFPVIYQQALANLSQDKGANEIILNAHPNVVSTSLPEAALDIDRKQDLAQFLHHNGHSAFSKG